MTFYIKHRGQQYAVSRIRGKDKIRKSWNYRAYGGVIEDKDVVAAVAREDERALREAEYI